MLTGERKFGDPQGEWSRPIWPTETRKVVEPATNLAADGISTLEIPMRLVNTNIGIAEIPRSLRVTFRLKNASGNGEGSGENGREMGEEQRLRV